MWAEFPCLFLSSLWHPLGGLFDEVCSQTLLCSMLKVSSWSFLIFHEIQQRTSHKVYVLVLIYKPFELRMFTPKITELERLYVWFLFIFTIPMKWCRIRSLFDKMLYFWWRKIIDEFLIDKHPVQSFKNTRFLYSTIPLRKLASCSF